MMSITRAILSLLGGSLGFGASGADGGSLFSGDNNPFSLGGRANALDSLGLGDIPAMNHSVDLDDEMAARRRNGVAFTPSADFHRAPPVNAQVGEVTPGVVFGARSAALGQLDGGGQRPAWNGGQTPTPVSAMPTSRVQSGGGNGLVPSWESYLAPTPLAPKPDPRRPNAAVPESESSGTPISDDGASASDGGSRRVRKMTPEKRKLRFARLTQMRESRVRQSIHKPEDWVVRDRDRFFSGEDTFATVADPTSLQRRAGGVLSDVEDDAASAPLEFDGSDARDDRADPLRRDLLADHSSQWQDNGNHHLDRVLPAVEHQRVLSFALPDEVVIETFLLGFVRRPGAPGEVPRASAEYKAVQRFLEGIAGERVAADATNCVRLGRSAGAKEISQRMDRGGKSQRLWLYYGTFVQLEDDLRSEKRKTMTVLRRRLRKQKDPVAEAEQWVAVMCLSNVAPDASKAWKATLSRSDDVLPCFEVTFTTCDSVTTQA